MFRDFSRIEQICQNPSSVHDAMRYLKDIIRHPDSQWRYGIRLLRWSYHIETEWLYVCVAHVTLHADMEGGQGDSVEFLRGVIDMTVKISTVSQCSSVTEAQKQIQTHPKLAAFLRGFTVDDAEWRYA